MSVHTFTMRYVVKWRNSGGGLGVKSQYKRSPNLESLVCMLWWMSDVIELRVAYQQILTDKPLAGESGGDLHGKGGATQAQHKLYSKSCSHGRPGTIWQTE